MPDLQISPRKKKRKDILQVSGVPDECKNVIPAMVMVLSSFTALIKYEFAA